MNHDVRRLIKLKKVVELTGLSRSSIYRKMKSGDFPVPDMQRRRLDAPKGYG